MTIKRRDADKNQNYLVTKKWQEIHNLNDNLRNDSNLPMDSETIICDENLISKKGKSKYNPLKYTFSLCHVQKCSFSSCTLNVKQIKSTESQQNFFGKSKKTNKNVELLDKNYDQNFSIFCWGSSKSNKDIPAKSCECNEYELKKFNPCNCKKFEEIVNCKCRGNISAYDIIKLNEKSRKKFPSFSENNDPKPQKKCECSNFPEDLKHRDYFKSCQCPLYNSNETRKKKNCFQRCFDSCFKKKSHVKSNYLQNTDTREVERYLQCLSKFKKQMVQELFASPCPSEVIPKIKRVCSESRTQTIECGCQIEEREGSSDTTKITDEIYENVMKCITARLQKTSLVFPDEDCCCCNSCCCCCCCNCPPVKETKQVKCSTCCKCVEAKETKVNRGVSCCNTTKLCNATTNTTSRKKCCCCCRKRCCCCCNNCRCKDIEYANEFDNFKNVKITKEIVSSLPKNSCDKSDTFPEDSKYQENKIRKSTTDNFSLDNNKSNKMPDDLYRLMLEQPFPSSFFNLSSDTCKKYFFQPEKLYEAGDVCKTNTKFLTSLCEAILFPEENKERPEIQSPIDSTSEANFSIEESMSELFAKSSTMSVKKLIAGGEAVEEANKSDDNSEIECDSVGKKTPTKKYAKKSRKKYNTNKSDNISKGYLPPTIIEKPMITKTGLMSFPRQSSFRKQSSSSKVRSKINKSSISQANVTKQEIALPKSAHKIVEMKKIKDKPPTDNIKVCVVKKEDEIKKLKTKHLKKTEIGELSQTSSESHNKCKTPTKKNERNHLTKFTSEVYSFCSKNDISSSEVSTMDDMPINTNSIFHGNVSDILRNLETRNRYTPFTSLTSRPILRALFGNSKSNLETNVNLSNILHSCEFTDEGGFYERAFRRTYKSNELGIPHNIMSTEDLINLK